MAVPKMMETKNITIGEVNFAIYHFNAFYAAGLSAELGKFLGPVIIGIMPVLAARDAAEEAAKQGKAEDIAGIPLSDAMPAIIQGLQTLDGATVQRLMKELLTDQGNISCEYRDENGRMKQAVLNEDLVNQFFCGDINGMIELAVEVINYNYEGFFGNLLSLYGSQISDTATQTSNDMVTLT